MAAGRTLALSAALAAALACVQDDGSPTPFHRLIEVTPANEREMGARLDAWARANLRLIDDPFVLASVNDLGQSLVRRVEPQPFVYRFRVVDDPTLNAFAGPAGYIYFHAGLILAAGSVDELAGVMAHEIAHAKRSHVARSIEKATVPDLLAKLVGVGVAVAADEPGAMVAAEGVSASLQLAYSRELEAEADEVGAAFLVRAGFDPMGMATFFERLGAQKQPELGFEIPPYLQSHPQVEARLDAAVARARSTTQAGEVDPGLREAFPSLQLRLARVLDSGRTTLPSGHPAPDPRVSGEALATAQRQAAAGDLAAAIATLADGEAREPNDPRLPFRRGELLRDQGQREDAIAAWRRALALDPEVALTYFQIGRAYQELGDRVNAVFYLEQAERRFEPRGSGRIKAERMLRLLTYPVIAEAGFADGADSSGADTPAGRSSEEFPLGARGVTWWARVEPEWMERRGEIELRWIDPTGRVVKSGPAEAIRRPYAMAALDAPLSPLGIWRVEARLEAETIDRRTFHVVPAD
ncbi:MAG: M48 family metalloprotease [Myxococcota bacterium]